jgi:hypothetical protein
LLSNIRTPVAAIGISRPGAEISAELKYQNLKELPIWHRLQLAKSFAPKVLVPLWHAAQLSVREGAKCIDASGADTCLPRAEPARTVWQLAQLSDVPRMCRAWLKFTLNALAAVDVRTRRPGWWQTLQEDIV